MAEPDSNDDQFCGECGAPWDVEHLCPMPDRYRFGTTRPTTPPEPYKEVTDEDHKGRELDTQG